MTNARGTSKSVPCPSCGCIDSSTIDSRPTSEGSCRRRRTCGQCEHRFTTYEVLEKDFLTGRSAQKVVKDVELHLFEAAGKLSRLRLQLVEIESDVD